MSLDVVDDLHNAEDEIGTLRHVLSIVVARWDAGMADVKLLDLMPEAISAARVALAGDYCRPSCYGRLATDAAPGDDETYGYCDDTCGCPCHGRE